MEEMMTKTFLGDLAKSTMLVQSFLKKKKKLSK